ncbi:MAG: PEGA domain-containing protein [Acidobacteria bacterium]|nr:PEGA domain-containing protein [Acidobacteriota bacterium]
MDRSAAKAMPAEEHLFRDGLGDRLLIRDANGRPLHESLVLRAELSAVPSFEFALSERMTELDKFDHPSFVPVRSLVRIPGPVPRISLVADYFAGTRLSDILARCESDGHRLPTGTALFLLKEILGAVSVFHRRSGNVAHGALAPERIVIGEGQVRITDYVLGSAIEQLRFSPERYWSELRVAVPSSAGGSRVDRRVDVAQVGMIAVALFAGRRLRDAEHIGGLGEVLMGLTQQAGSDRQSLSLPVRGWLVKALHLDSRRTFVSAIEAEHDLDEAIAEAGLSPSSAEVDILGARPRRVAAPIVVKAAPPPKPVLDVPAEVTPKQQDAWGSHDAYPQTMYQRGSTTVDSQPKPENRITRRIRTLLKIGLLGGLIAGAFTAAQFIPPPAGLFSSVGTLVVESKPSGAQVLVDRQSQGVTPLALKLDSGKHEVEIRGSGQSRVFSVWVPKGERVSQYVELQTAPTRR